MPPKHWPFKTWNGIPVKQPAPFPTEEPPF